MLAYQMIYTACGKDKSGAFSVWSKSQEITKQECDEIIKLMNYRKPRNAPYDPTEEDIKRFFPKKYAFFSLSSGRKCIAQSNYIGNVYSELDGRSGNFLIHAFIFDELENINPFFIFDFDGFKSELKYEEWHDEPAPESLPSVDINVPINANKINITDFINTFGHGFLSLLQAVINSVESDEEIVFVDSEEKQKELYYAMGMLLPKSILEKSTFCTQYSSQSEFAIQSIGGIAVKIRNPIDVGVPNGINVQESMDSGKPVFDFDKRVFSEIKAGRYAVGVINDVKTNSLFSVLNEVDKVNRIMLDVQCDVETAYSIFKFINKDYSFFDGFDEFLSVYQKASEKNYIDITVVADEIYNAVFKSGRFGKNSAVIPLLSLIYNAANKELKDTIIIDFINSLNDFIPDESDDIINVFKKSAPFSWDDFVDCIIEKDYYGKYISNINTFAKSHLVYNAILDALNKKLGDVNENKNALLDIINKALQNKKITELSVLINEGKNISNKFELWVLVNSLKRILYKPSVNENEIKFAFELTGILTQETKEQGVCWILVSNLNSPFLIKYYIEYAGKDPKFYEELEHKLSKEDDYKSFFMKKDAFIFQNTEQVTMRLLDDYFNKFYINKLDNGIFVKKLAKYLASRGGTQKATDCLQVFEKISKLPDDFCDNLEIYRLIESEIYKVSLSELIMLQVSQIQQLVQLNNKLTEHRIKTSGKFEILFVLATMAMKFGKVYSERVLSNNEIFKGLSLQQVEIIFEDHLKDVFEFYFTIRKESRMDSFDVVSNVFGIAFKSIDRFDNKLIKELDTLKEKEYNQIMADLMAYAFCQKDSLSTSLKTFIKKYIDSLSKLKYKKLFKKVQEILDDKTLARVNPFIDDYLEKHKGFLEKLFEKKERKDKK